MDLSGLIFVVLAIAWAGYLIPRALRQHEDNATNAPIDSFSDTVRVLERTPATMKALLAKTGARSAVQTEVAPAEAGPGDEPVVDREAIARAKAAQVAQEGGQSSVQPAARGVSRSSAGAARRRRRVLGTLLFLAAAIGALVLSGLIPAWSPVIPAVLVVVWLVMCRLMVRSAAPVARARVSAPVQSPAAAPSVSTEEAQTPQPQQSDRPVAAEPGPVSVSVSVPKPAVSVADSSSDEEDSLWDPLPLTLPTYVTKPAARRTVRSIDLTQPDVTSSGHQAEDSAVAREADAARAAERSNAEEQRRASGA